ncbi:THO complex subunit 2, partial [Pseudolycoriella hygida]
AGYFSQVRNTKKSSLRLKEALASNDLAVTLCLLMAQQKHCVIYRETAHSHLKLVGKLYDQCQDTLVQFGTFLGLTYSLDEYMERLPSIHSMLQEYHIHSDVAFFLARPMFTHQINQKYDQLRKADTSTKKLSMVQKQEKYLEATAAIISPIVESVRPLHPSKVWEDISPQFLVTFWSLSMYDLQVPVDSYQKEIDKIKLQLNSKEMNMSKGRKEQERFTALIDKLHDERRKQHEHVDKIMHRLNQEKDSCYKQRRFNLFREESEGYAKLITELNQDPTSNVSVDHLLEIIKSLIGCFNLDPNRVLDIILESFETRPEQNKLFIGLLKAYMPNGSIICEVLGYKYRHFSDGKTPTSLYIITALLLQSKIILLDEIFSWLSPTDKSIQIDWENDLDEAKEFVRKLNLIITNNNAKEPEVEVEKEENDDKYDTNQKWNLCEALLHVGDWPTAQKLIEKLPKYSVMVRENVALALCDLVHRVIDPVYVSKCSVTPSRKERVYTSNINKLSTPQAKSLFDLRVNAFPMAVQLGPSLYLDPVLLYKLVRLCRVSLTEMSVDSSTLPKTQTDELLYHDIMTLLDSSILPSLSYMECNCCVAEEIWSVIKFLPYHYRYSLYGRWKNDTYLVHPKLIRRRGIAQKRIKALMKRVSKENVKPVGRSIGKLSHCSPGFLFDYILIQIQIFDNLIGPVVDSLKYLTSLSYDVLGYCLIEALAQADKNRFKHDGTSISMWLQSSANFCGSIYKKYNIELSGLLQYVANQLKAQKSLDLLILKEVVQKMTGIEATEEMTVEQLNAMSGGELLRSEAGYFSQVRNTKKSSLRLKEALASNDLAVTLCLLMAQQKHCVIYRETAHSHLKLVGKLYDQCQDTLVQFGTFLGLTYSLDEYMERLPSIHSMLQEYHIHSDVAFFLARPMFTHQINQKYDQLRKADTSTKKLSMVQKQEKYLEATAAIISPIVESVRPLHPSKVWEDISPQFLVTFWSLSMYDLQVPVDSYQKEIDKIKLQLNSKEMNMSKGRKEQERFTALIDKLHDERRKQHEHVDKIMHRLNQEKDS